MTTAALDLATTTGYAAVASGVLCSGTFKCKANPKQTWGEGFLNFRTWLREFLDVEKPDKLFYEEVMRWSSGDAAKVYCGLRAIMLLECWQRGVTVVGLSVGSIKKHATGSGKADKQQMILAAKKRWKVTPKDDNEADALAILSLGLTQK